MLNIYLATGVYSFIFFFFAHNVVFLYKFKNREFTTGAFNFSLTLELGVIEFTVPVSGAKVLSETNSVEKDKGDYRLKRIQEQDEKLRRFPEL